MGIVNFYRSSPDAMLIINADDSRLIDLPGVGPCPRPVDIDQAVTGFNHLKSLRIYRFQPGPPIHGDSEGDEVFILPLSGAFDIVITGTHGAEARVTGAGPIRAIYMTPHHAYRLMPRSPAMVAYARAEAVGIVPSQTLQGTASHGLAEHLTYRFVQVQPGARTQVAGEALVHVVRGACGVGGQGIVQGQTLALSAGEAISLDVPSMAELLIVGV